MNAHDIQEAARRLIQNEVCYCVSSLISSAIQNMEAAVTLGFGEDDLYELASRAADADDYRDAAPEGWDVALDGRPDRWAYSGPDGECDDGRGYESELDAWRAAFSVAGADEPDGREVFEHWLVTGWFADKLEAKGESVVRDVLGLTVWGRTTTGQAIYADGVIEEIVRDLHAPDADLREASDGATCRACGRPEADCSAEPCAAVIADREG